ncbi:MAG: repeat-containing protein [Gemmatimonadetes bacterium]|nr:repeat-containing protein [Gemmatimonadota bacterium]
MWYLLSAFPYLGILSLVAQVLFAVHAVRTGRNNWLWILIVFPVVGPLVYLFAEYLPSQRASTGSLRAVSEDVIRRIHPAADIRRWQDQVALSPSLVNRMQLARAYARAGQSGEALAIYDACLQGHYATDPVLLWEMCRTHFENGALEQARDFYERLGRETAPSKEQQLLSARIHEAAGDTDAALAEYGVLSRQSAGEEARTRYALLLRRLGREDEAARIFNEVLRHARISSGVYRRAQKPWIAIAKAELKRREPAAQ